VHDRRTRRDDRFRPRLHDRRRTHHGRRLIGLRRGWRRVHDLLLNHRRDFPLHFSRRRLHDRLRLVNLLRFNGLGLHLNDFLFRLYLFLRTHRFDHGLRVTLNRLREHSGFHLPLHRLRRRLHRTNRLRSELLRRRRRRLDLRNGSRSRFFLTHLFTRRLDERNIPRERLLLFHDGHLRHETQCHQRKAGMQDQ
jgi:hypothetical protein